MAVEELNPLGGRGTQYPRFKELTDIIGTNLDVTLSELNEEFEELGNKDALAVLNAIVNVLADLFGKNVTSFTLREILYCPSYECAIIYFKIFDDVLDVRRIFLNEYKKQRDAEEAREGVIWDQLLRNYYPDGGLAPEFPL